jgi:hypothetical protein
VDAGKSGDITHSLYFEQGASLCDVGVLHRELLEEKIHANVFLKNVLVATDLLRLRGASPCATAISLRYAGAVKVGHLIP